MACLSPLTGWRGPDGKITSSSSKAYVDRPITVPCGHCRDCRINRRQQWSNRIFHENKSYLRSMFLTLTYADENLPFGGSLVKDEISKFIRQLRDAGKDIRYYGCAEYGGDNRRPHYHIIIFGYWPSDAKVIDDTPGKELYESASLLKIWGKGKADFGDVTTGSCNYVAGYIVDKINGEPAADFYTQTDPETGEVFTLEPPFSRQSLRPGIGHDFCKKWLSDIYPKDQIIIDGQPVKPPRYYDKLCEKYRPDLWAKTKAKRFACEQENWLLVERQIDHNKPELGTKTTRVHKDPNAYKGSEKHMQTRTKILEHNSKKRGNFQ